MSGPYGRTPITYIFGQIDDTVLKTTQTIWEGLSQQYSTTITTLFILMIVLYGWGFLHGWVKGTWGEAFSNVLKIAFVYYLTMNWSVYSEWFYSMFYSGTEEISRAIAQAGGKGAGKAGIAPVIDKFMAKGIDTAFQIIDQASLDEISLWALGWIVFLLVLIVSAVAAFFIALSKVALGVLLAVGILFIVFLLFENTRNYFTSWIGIMFNYALVCILTVVLMQFMIGLGDTILQTINEAGAGGKNPEMSFWHYVGFIFFCIVFAGLLITIPGTASALSNGLAMAGTSVATSLGMRGIAGVAKAPGKTVSSSYKGGRAVYNFFRGGKKGGGNNVNPG